jgi:hypothetical protein
MKFHVEQWTGKEWIRISGAIGYDRLEQAEMQKACRARATKTDIDDFAIVCCADYNSITMEAA